MSAMVVAGAQGASLQIAETEPVGRPDIAYGLADGTLVELLR